MRPQPTTDPLALWRGIDDAAWREALRQSPMAAVALPALPAVPAAPRRPAPAAKKVPVPA
jgi:hypothetical protein